MKWAPNMIPLLLCLQVVAAAAGPIVLNANTGVSYNGTSAGGVDQFQNIFYAKDTTGINRFAPPIPFLPTRGSTVQATASGAACPQPSMRFPIYPFESDATNQSENCLSLRIARPANTPSTKKLPVLFWLYGGAFTYGFTYSRLYNPVGLVQESVASGHPVIYVSANYRVGIFGFAASDALRKAKSENAGLRDQRLALQWVKDNIAAFGGDPDNITLFGQSAGAVSTGLQIFAFGGQKGAVFKKAIIESGSISGDLSDGPPANNTAVVATALGCTGDSNAQLACLRAAPEDKLLAASLAQGDIANPPFGATAYRPVVDGDFIPDQPSKLILVGSFTKGISVIATWTEDDGSEFIPPVVNTEAAVTAYFSTLINDTSIRDQLLALYPVEEFESQATQDPTETPQYYRASRIFRDLNIACRALNLTYEFSIQGSKSTYLSFFNSTRLQPVWDSEASSYYRIGHSSDVPYVFNEQVAGGDNSPSALSFSAQVSRSVSQFATSGNPSTSTVNWPIAWNGQGGTANPTIFVIGGPYGSGPVTLGATSTAQRSTALAQEKLIQRCAFINSKTNVGLI